MKTKHLLGMLLFLCTACLTGCSDDDLEPLSLHQIEGHSIQLYYGTQGGVTIIGGEGEYSFICESPLLKGEMTQPNYILFEPLGVGTAVVTIKDRSGQTYELNVDIVYRTENYMVSAIDVSVEGEELTEGEQKRLREEVLNSSLVQPGGFYQFVYTEGLDTSSSSGNQTTVKGMAVVYPRKGEKGQKGTFEQTVCYTQEKYFSHYEYVIHYKGSTHSYIATYLKDSSTKTSVLPEYISFAFVEDVTEQFSADYPKVKKVEMILRIDQKMR